MINDKQPSYYAIIPATVRYDNNLKFAERLLYGEITALIGKEGYCFANNSYFANLFNVIPGTISRWISHLEKLGYIKVDIIRNEKNEVIQRKIFILDISCRKIVDNTYKQFSTYPYEQKKQYPISKKAKDNNINIKIDRLYNYIINRDEKIINEFNSQEDVSEFYSILQMLDFLYTKEMMKSFTNDNIEKLKIIFYCLKELLQYGKKDIINKFVRQDLLDVYDNCKKFEIKNIGTDNEIYNFYDYYYTSVLTKLKAKFK